jgi:Na+/H+-dicarboxylate symporter
MILHTIINYGVKQYRKNKGLADKEGTSLMSFLGWSAFLIFVVMFVAAAFQPSPSGY